MAKRSTQKTSSKNKKVLTEEELAVKEVLDSIKPTRVTAFEMITALSTGDNLVAKSDDPEQLLKASLDVFITNKAFSLYPDTILYANDMNRWHNLSREAVWEYYINSLRPRKRYAKWPKATKDEVVEIICEVYNVNRDIASQYNSLLNESQRKALIESRNKGG